VAAFPVSPGLFHGVPTDAVERTNLTGEAGWKERERFRIMNLRKHVKAGVAVLAAAATLGGGLVVSSTAMADGGGGWAPGGGGSIGSGVIGWAYQDNNDGGFGGASLDAFKKAVSQMGATFSDYNGQASAKANTAITMANNECVTRFNAAHPGENANCRMVAVGVVATPSGHVYSGDGYASESYWRDAWNSNASVQNLHHNNGQQYRTSDGFSDAASRSVDSIAAAQWADPNNPVAIVIMLNQYEPVGEVPPSPPSKTVTPGVSADGMVNTTTITSKTGVGGRKMRFTDSITPNGVNYKVSNYKVTDNGTDVSGKFTFAHTGDQVTADWKNGDLPDNHTFKFSFDITVSKPDFGKVQDVGKVTWNDKGTGDTDSHEFPTWRPNPDKSWVKQDADGRWQAVIDPKETNSTGADRNVFLDGDLVGSVVNGTIAANLAQAPKSLTLTDDWSNADYIFDAADASKVRVYEADASTDRESSIPDIMATGKDVTDRFDVTIEGTTGSISAHDDYLAELKGLKQARQLTLFIPGTVNFANGKGAEQVRKDFNKDAGAELTFCTNPGEAQIMSMDGSQLTNAGSETVNGHEIATNEPWICGYVPPVAKDVIGESSQGGDQSSVDGKVVFPGQRVEYQMTTTPKLPQDLAYGVKSVTFTDSYDEYLNVDKQTLELMDLDSGKVIPKSKYSTKWDDAKRMMAVKVTDAGLIAQWRAGANPRVQLRFEGTVAETAPTDHKVANKWALTLNNSLTPSNEVFNIPPSLNPSKEDNQSSQQGDPSVSIDGKTMLLGDTGNYVINLDAKQSDQAYKVWRLGVTDDYDDEYVRIDPSKVEIVGADGRDVTGRFNVQLSDGVAYVFARTVDTEIPATGETVKGDPQPADLKAYAALGDKDHDPLADPAIDQTLLGQGYEVILPYKVIKVDDGYTVRNKAVQVTNGVRVETNEVSNPLKPINPGKDVTISVGGDSVDGQSVWLDSTFLYRLSSSILPAGRAYPEVSEWSITDPLDTKVDSYTGQWAVYLQRDLYRDGKVIAAKGERVAGSGFDSSGFGGDLFTLVQDDHGVVRAVATETYLGLVSADNAHEAGWESYVQCTRVSATERQDNTFTERLNGTDRPSNVVWTRTPDLTPSIHIEKWDRPSGWPKGDRDSTRDALHVSGDTEIVFTIENTSKDEQGHGAWFRARDLRLEDSTIAGDGTVTDITYPDGWDSLVLKPGDKVEVTGTLKGVTTVHTDRAKVTGVPLVECPATDDDPFDGGTGGDGDGSQAPDGAVTVEGRTLCEDTRVESNTDDWSGRAGALGDTGTAVVGLLAVVAVLAAGGIGLFLLRKRRNNTHSDASHQA
jgi:adhesin isopeptide-forming family sspB-C2 type protein